MGIPELFVVVPMVVFYGGIIAVIVYVIRLGRRLVAAVEKIADKIDASKG